MNVEMVKTDMSCDARGCRIDERMPVAVKGNGPSTSAATHPDSVLMCLGTFRSRQTSESSEGVLVTEVIGPPVAHVGISASGSIRHTAYLSGRNVICSGKAGDRLVPSFHVGLLDHDRVQTCTMPVDLHLFDNPGFCFVPVFHLAFVHDHFQRTEPERLRYVGFPEQF